MVTSVTWRKLHYTAPHWLEAPMENGLVQRKKKFSKNDDFQLGLKFHLVEKMLNWADKVIWSVQITNSFLSTKQLSVGFHIFEITSEFCVLETKTLPQANKFSLAKKW